MVKTIYLSVLTICIIVMLIIVKAIRKEAKSNVIAWTILHLNILATIAALAAGVGMAASGEGLAKLGIGVFYAMIDWLLIGVMSFTRLYVKDFRTHGTFTKVLYGIAAVDGISLIANAFTEHAFSVSYKPLKIAPNEMSYVLDVNWAGYLHYAFCLILVILIIYTLAMEIKNSPKMYRTNCVIMLLVFLVMVVVCSVYFLSISHIDYSVFIYVVFDWVIAFGALKYVPKKFMEAMNIYVMDELSEGIICFDRDDKCVFINLKAREFFGSNVDLVFVDNWFESWREMRPAEKIDNCSWEEVREENGEERHITLKFMKMFDEADDYIGCYFTYDDTTAEYQVAKMHEFNATHDILTGVYNKQRFYDEVRRLLDEHPDETYLMIASDIKNFKVVNDVFGTDVGDEVLKSVANELMARTRHDDLVYARLESDRFAICIPKIRYAERPFLQAMDRIESYIDNSAYKMHTQMGVYEITDKSIDISVMCDRASLAIDSIKDSYTKRIAYYNEDLRNEVVSEQQIMSQFETALEKGEFKIFIQPQVTIDGVVKGGEALVRWIHPERGLVPPMEFIPALEKTGLISKLDMHVWELACIQLKKWKDEGHDDLYISVNISVKDFYYVDIYKTFVGLVEKYGINPANLNLEITETAFMIDVRKQMALMNKLRAYGFKIEIDDFGSGYSSLNMLKELNVDVLKIDMAFLSVTENEERSRRIVEMVIELSKALDMVVVTEGVETLEQVSYLTTAGCDIFQGYYFARPMPVEEFEEKYMD